MKFPLPKEKIKLATRLSFSLLITTVIILIVVSVVLQYRNLAVLDQSRVLSSKLSKVESDLKALETEDQVVKNKKLEDEIKNIQKEYKNALLSYEKILDSKSNNVNTKEADALFAKTLSYLSERNYSSASLTIARINSLLKTEETKISSNFTPPANISSSNAPPGSGYSRQLVKTKSGSYMVDIIAGDLGSTRVIVDTASEADCKDNCPVMSLGAYASRNGAYAGINGSYFCPASYPTCAGKANSFDTLLMNKNKKYFNSDNNVYSTVPAVIFTGGGVRFVGRSLEWGRDTGVDGVLANYPLLVSGGQSLFSGGGDAKLSSKGPRSFVGNKGSVVYIGVVHNASVADSAQVLKALGLDNALNLDSGGSTALWNSGYKVGPGRDIPNAILFLRK